MPNNSSRITSSSWRETATKSLRVAANVVPIPSQPLSYLRYRLQYARLLLREDDRESVTFYRELQNTKVNENEAYPRGYGIGRAQIEFLKRQGLRPSDSLFDLGCGNLRGGRFIINYLQVGNYTGADISEEAIKQGWKTVREMGLIDRAPTLLVNTDLRFNELGGEEFDRVFANSVLTHTPKESVIQLFSNLDKVLNQHGVAYLSYNHANEEETDLSNNISRSNLYRYPFESLQTLGEENGFDVEHDSYDEHPNDRMNMLVIE
jgi:cyclopropane fatty-acyl-phospholipid synthase-like methyltransferase